MALNYTDQYIQSILSFLDYATFDGTGNQPSVLNKNLILDDEKIRFNNLIEDHLKDKVQYNAMKSSLDFFTEHFEIVKQTTSGNPINGFSATTYKLKSAIEGSNYSVGEIFVSYRGTQPTDVGDILTDIKLTFSDQFSFPYISSQEFEAYNYLKDTVDDQTNDGIKINISGHSLGGYLAARSYYKLSEVDYERIGSVSTFNGAGFSFLDGPFITPTKRAKYSTKINNIYSYRGLNVTSGNASEILDSNALELQGTLISTFQHLGPRIGSFTENPGGAVGNHSVAMLAQSMGFFSILSKLIIGVSSVKGDDSIEYKDNDAVVYLINKMLMGAYSESSDFNMAYNTLAAKIMEMFNIQEDSSSVAGAPSSQFLSLANYFHDNPILKIKILDGINSASPALTNIDSNSNRAYMYALINDLSFTVIVPDSYNTGIYQRVSSDGYQYTNNIKYNVEYYTQDYIDLRIKYNKIYTKVLSDKILNSLPSTFVDTTLNIQGFSKFAFIDETNVYGSPNSYSIIYVNTTKSEYERGPVQGQEPVKLIYFKADTGRYLDVKLHNAIIYDTPGNDSIRIYSNNNVINSTYGTDIIEIVSGTIGNVIMLKDLTGTDKEQSLILRNNSDLEHSLTIKSDNINFGELIGKLGDNKDFTLDFGNKVVILSGQTDLDVKGAQYNAATMNALVRNFPELFTSANGHNLVFDENFIDDYIKITSKNFEGQLGYENTQTMSAEHAAYVIGKITGYTNDLNDTASSFIDEMKAHINSRITNISTDLDSDGVQDDILNTVIPLVKDKVKAHSVAFIIQSKLNDFKYLDLGNQVNMSNKDNMADRSADNIYGKKETKNYISHYNSEGEKYWVWDGKYYYNRAFDGVQIGAFYDGNESGYIMNYYNENITIKKDTLIANGVLDDGLSIEYIKSISGSDGSDLLIGDQVYGQTNYQGILGENINIDSRTKQNGNDILIGREASAYSGNNFIYGAESARGGSGNDLLIGGGEIYANQNFEYDAESSSNENEIIILNSANVYSSNGKNNIVDLSDGGSIIFATKNDNYIGGNGRALFIGGYDAYLALKVDNISFGDGVNTFLQTIINRSILSTVNAFYNSHSNNSTLNKNTIYAGSGGINAVLGIGDYLENIKGGGAIIALGNNDVFIKDNSIIRSLGSSNISIYGNDNIVYLGQKDNYNLYNASSNKLYSRGYLENINVGNDSYHITGKYNKLVLGQSTYNIKLDGVASTVVFETNQNENSMVISESGFATIYVGVQNKLSIESESEISLMNGEISNLIINTQNSVSIKNVIAEEVSLSNYNGIDNYNNINLINSSISNLIVKTGIITGSVNDVLVADLEGTVGNFQLQGAETGTNFKLNGFIEGINTTLENVKSFVFDQRIRMNEQSQITINNSNINTYNTNGNLFLLSNDTNINNINATGRNNWINVDGDIGTANLSSSSYLSFNANSVRSLNVNHQDTILIKGDNIGGEISLSTSDSYSFLNVDNAHFIEIINKGNDKIFLTVSNSDTINIISGFYNNALFTNVDIVNINLDTVSPMSSFNGDNIHLTSIKPLSARYSNNKYYLNNVEFTLLPDTVTVSGRQYTSEQLAVLFEVLKKSNLMQATAIVDVTGVGYDSIGDTNNEGIHVDSGIYIGTDGNDIVYATDNKAYRIKGNKGNDVIDFGTKPINAYTHIIEYNRGDGLDTITSNTENIEIRLGNISSNELSFKNVDNSITNAKTLQVFLGSEQIFAINGFELSNMQFKATDKTLTKADVISLISTIYGTDNSEVIEGLTGDTYIVAGKGKDTINFIGSNKNVLYYNKGDGVDIVNSINDFEIIFSADILKDSVRRSKVSDNVFDLYLDGIKILTLTNTDKAKLVFSDGQIVNGYYINSSMSEQLGGKPFYENGIYTGSDLIDYFNLEEGSYHLKGNKGNDRFTFEGNSEHSILDYTEGDGIDIIEGYSKNIDINLINMSSEFLTTSNENDYLYLYYKGFKIMRIDEIDKSNINIHMADKSFTQPEIFIWMYGIDEGGEDNGGESNTDGDDIITINPKTDNNIYAGKGNDIINLISNSVYPDIINNIYYFDGDGHETINNDKRTAYTILLANTMLESDVSYVTGFDNGQITLHILYKNEMIFTIPDFENNEFTINYLSSGNSIDMMTLFEQLTIINGTDGDDILTSDMAVAFIGAGDGDDVINISSNIMASDIYAGMGNDVININNHGFNTINYDDGDGYDIIVLENHETSVNLSLYDYDEANIRFEYDVSNPNHLNIYNNDTKIIMIENYIIDNTSFESIVIELNDTTLEAQDINNKASESSQAARMLADSNINGLISVMAIDNNDVDGLGEGQSASIFIKKNE